MTSKLFSFRRTGFEVICRNAFGGHGFFFSCHSGERICLWMDDDLYDPYTHSSAFMFERLWARNFFGSQPIR